MSLSSFFFGNPDVPKLVPQPVTFPSNISVINACVGIMQGEDSDPIQAGMLVSFKTYSFLDTKYYQGDCFAHGPVWVIKIEEIKDQSALPGELSNALVAYVKGDRIRTTRLDARLLISAGAMVVHPILQDFIKDVSKPVISVDDWLRPRSGTRFYDEHCGTTSSVFLSSKSTIGYDFVSSPARVLKVNSSDVVMLGTSTLTGMLVKFSCPLWAVCDHPML